MLMRLYSRTFTALDHRFGDLLLTTLARFIFAATLFMFFWKSALTKIGPGLEGLIEPSVGAYAQILPLRMEAVGFDPTKLTSVEHVIVYAGTYAEFILPVMVVIGLFTRLAALGMIGFIAVMTLTDVFAHHVDAATIGSWFDKDPSGLIADQRMMWVFVLLVSVFKGPGPFSLDRVLGRRWGYR